jgi:hypothetical protein
MRAAAMLFIPCLRDPDDESATNDLSSTIEGMSTSKAMKPRIWK